MAARRSAADGMKPEDVAAANPDYLFFLRHLYPDGTSYVAELPAADGVSPPVVIKYEPPVNGGVAGGVRTKDEDDPVVIDPPSPPAAREEEMPSSGASSNATTRKR